MIRYRSAAFFGRLYAPEIMMGMHTHEEVVDVEAQIISTSGQAQLEDSVTIEELQRLYDEKLPLMNKAQMDSAKRIIENKEEGNYRKLHTLLISIVNE